MVEMNSSAFPFVAIKSDESFFTGKLFRFTFRLKKYANNKRAIHGPLKMSCSALHVCNYAAIIGYRNRYVKQN